MKTIKQIFYLAASLMLLVNIPSNVYAAGNDWFEKDYNFYAYYDGMGNINFDLLTWTYGAGHNHWAGGKGETNDSYRTYVEYSINNKKGESKDWKKLFYYYGDNVVNKKEKDEKTKKDLPGRAWFNSNTSYSFFTIPEGNKIEEKKLTNASDSVDIPHAKDERHSVNFKLRWGIPTEAEGKYLSIRIHVSDTRADAFGYEERWEYTYTPIEDEIIEEGTSAPELMEPVLFMGGNKKENAGMFLVPYAVMDELVDFTTSFNSQTYSKMPSIGSFAVKAEDSIRHNVYITASIKKVNDVVVSRRSNKINIPAYHTIKSFKVEPKMSRLKDSRDSTKIALINSGYKLLTWTIDNSEVSDAVETDYFEIERAYKSDFSDAEQLDYVVYTAKDTNGVYQYIDETTINNPYGGNYIYYRIRRASASSYGWEHSYAKSYTYVGRVKQIGLNLFDKDIKITPYAAFRDCATDSTINNSSIDFTGQFVWPIVDSAVATAWDSLTRIEVVLWENGKEAQRNEIKIKDLHTTINGTRLIREFEYVGPLPKTCQDYDLSVRLNTDVTRFDKPQKTDFWFYPKRRIEAINITSITASDKNETHPEHTNIRWTADGEPDYFAIYRDGDSIDIVDSRTNWYNDTGGVPGQPYNYKVKAVTYCTKRLESEKTAKGARSRVGYIQGFVSYANGDKMANIHVYLTKDRDTIAAVTTNANGEYKFSKIQYDLGDKGSTYSIYVASEQQDFYPAKGGTGPATVTLTSDSPAAHNINFLSDSYQRCSGRVLYTGTTIPVRDAYFLINGQVAKSSGDTIRSDASGNFTLSVPAGPTFTLTVAKKGHTFVNDGKLMINDTTALNAQKGPIDAVRFWDNTRTRLIGRLAGGDIQGDKELGFGLSKNNLGDSLKLVFELEGDNIAHFVYDLKDLTKKTRDTTFVRIIGTDTLRTGVRFEEKRIIVRPDSKTGEYMIDLPPVKYRIVEASANGYATLFSAGRTSETKDLTYSLDTIRKDHIGQQVWYHDTYSVIYHAPASVRVAQLRFGMPIEHYGEETVQGYTLDTTRIDSVYTHKDNKYVFGYPVYISGLQYGFRIYACEEYHYNNDINRDLDVVSLGNHKFTMYNGLLSGTSIVKGKLNDEGICDITVDVANVSYDAVGTAALKHLDVSVNVNGQDVHAQPIQAFVLGARLTGSDAMTKIGSSITVDDVLRDPPGSNSYAWIEKGATYGTSYNVSIGFDADVSMSRTSGKSHNETVGTIYAAGGKGGYYYGTFKENVSGTTYPWFSVAFSFSWNTAYNYSYTTSERIQTGSSNNIMGADATVFIGHTVNAYAMNSEVFTVVDSATLSRLQASIATGETKIVSQKDIHSPALIVTRDLAFTMEPSPVQFVYTQDHIVNQVIPQLVAEMSSLFLTGDTTSALNIADARNERVYWAETQDGKLVYDADTIVYHVLEPRKWRKLTPQQKPPFVNELHKYGNMIYRWLEILYDNEYKEFYGVDKMFHVKNFSVSANTTVTHSETGSAGYNHSLNTTQKVKADFVQNLNQWKKLLGDDETYNFVATILKDHIPAVDGNQGQGATQNITVTAGTAQTKISIVPNINLNLGQTSGINRSRNRTIGFTLSQAEYGYIDVDVYSLMGNVDSTTMGKWRDKATNTFTRDSLNTGQYECADFIYVLRGGATRCPWIGENKTQFFHPGTLLDPATVKLDEAHLEVDKHEVSGVAADGVAVFDLQIWNETEAAPGVANGPHNFTLKLLEGTNPNGAKASIDGLTLTGTGRNFYLNPGQVIHKKLEVRQGAVAINYDSLKLSLISDCDTSNYADQYISVHFLPASSPVRIATPDDKWVMNTNSPYDKQGYYLPVVIDGFDPDYANFDHIELQYKLSTQSEHNWVTLCSYYVDSVYYKKASGNKQMFNKEAGRIDNIHFYGERDPMEQRYDLRAVSYCRYGTGYVTKASEPVSGIKDTRRPELFGKVTPANGILTQQDYINVPFSEPIAYNYLDEDNNFQVIGFKNVADYYSKPTLTFSGHDKSFARTQTARDLSHSDFSIDLTIYPDENLRNSRMVFFSTGQLSTNSIEQAIEFGLTEDNRLYASIDSTRVNSDSTINLYRSFSRVTMTYMADTVRLYVGTKLVGKGKAKMTPFTAAPLTFGLGMNNLHPFTGRMAEARIWSKALTPAEIAATNNTCLTGYESGLLAYYPMTEGSGTTAYDKAHGADAILNNLTWSMPQGLALVIPDTAGVRLDEQWFNNSADADYTLLFSFKSNPLKPFSGNALLFGDKDAKIDANNKQIGIFMTQTGQIVLVADSVNRLVAEGNYKDGAWHTLGLVVSRGFNYTHLYIDDKLKAQTDGQFFGAWAMTKTFLGKNFENGRFDELSIWEFAMPQDYLSEFTTYAPNGQELGLRCYLPFDQRIKNAANIYETHYNRYNARLYYNSDKQEWYAKQDTVIRSQLDDKNTTTDVCPLIRNSEYENMRFSWTSRDNDLVINLKMPDTEINHKTIYFSLRDVEDLQGNRLLSPIAWSVYLDRNIIRWDEQNLWIIKSAGMMDTVVYTTITNTLGEDKSFVINGLPEWLTVDEPVGTLKPQEQRVLAFTVSGDLNAGDYVVPVSLTDETGLSDQMLVNVRVEAVFPNWSVPNDFNLNMNLIGTVHLRDGARSTYVDTDTRDIVGAFYGNTCVGMQSITSKEGSTANLYLKVYGKADMNKKDISLRLWQASTGKTFELTNSSDPTDQPKWRIRFVPDTVYGSVQKPIDFYVADSRVQNIPVYTGWNWISFNVQPTDINSSFVNVGGFETNDEIKAYSAQDNVSNYMESGWSKNIKLNYRNIYMLKVKNNMVLEVRGTATGQAPELTFGGGWNNLPCLFEANTPLDAAMSDYFNAAKDGDIITGYYQFAVFDNKQWVGSLESLIPGEGYMLYRQATDTVTVHFYPSAPATAPRTKVESERGSESRTYSTAMPIVAALESNEVAINLDNAVLRAYAHDELVGEAKAVDGMWFLLVHAKDNAELTFTVIDDKGEEHPASNVLNYGALAPTGTVHNPYLIRFGESGLRKVMEHGILYIHRNGNTYNAQGTKL